MLRHYDCDEINITITSKIITIQNKTKKNIILNIKNGENIKSNLRNNAFQKKENKKRKTTTQIIISF